MTADGIGARLVFLISAPRSGSTLLMRLLHATGHVQGEPELHLLPPLAHLGYWRTVDAAPYDQLQARDAVRDLVASLPGGEATYVAACRAYTDGLYGPLLAASGRRYLVDKTPANALVLPELVRLYPEARYVVLTRHPAALFTSYAHAFFDGDLAAAARFNPVLSRYLPAIGSFLRRAPVPHVQLSYEALVTVPEASLRRVTDFLGLPFDPGVLSYQRDRVRPGLGDPVGVHQHERPVLGSRDRWAELLAADPAGRAVIEAQLDRVPPEDLVAWGSPRDGLWALLDGVAGRTPPRRWDRHALARRLLLHLRRDIEHRPHGRLLARVRRSCDLLLRGS